MKADNEMNEKEIAFDAKLLECKSYIVKHLQNAINDKLVFGVNNMQPILKAFKDKQESKKTDN